jgi:hypothetical protein
LCCNQGKYVLNGHSQHSICYYNGYVSDPDPIALLPAGVTAIEQADALLVAALELLDGLRRYDAGAHVDLALQTLRGKHGAALQPPIDMSA